VQFPQAVRSATRTFDAAIAEDDAYGHTEHGYHKDGEDRQSQQQDIHSSSPGGESARILALKPGVDNSSKSSP
jgi:hypothetical protein